jgi:hypothetical protein
LKAVARDSVHLPVFRWACVALVGTFILTAGCTQKQSSPGAQQQAAISPATVEAGPWHLELKVSPEHPSMAKPITFTLHITREHAQPVTDAEVSAALTMKSMDMGTTQLKFTAKGNGDYEATMKDMDMSGPWNLAVDAVQGSTHVKQSFEMTVGD